jgi:hypothetical protein
VFSVVKIYGFFLVFLMFMVMLASSNHNSSTCFPVIMDNRTSGKDIMDDDIIQVSAIMYFFYCQVQYHKRFLEIHIFYPFLTTETDFRYRKSIIFLR